MKNNKLKKRDLQVFTTLVYDYLNKTYMKDLERSLDPEEVREYELQGSLSDLRDFAQMCVSMGRLNDPSCRYAPFLNSGACCCVVDLYDSVVLHHENLPDGMWKDFFDVLRKTHKEDADFFGNVSNCCDEFIVDYLNEDCLRLWIQDNISQEEYQNYKAVYDAGMVEILSEPATGFLCTILCHWLGGEKFNELMTK